MISGAGKEHGDGVTSKLIHGVQVKRLHWVCDERGKLIEVLRSDDSVFRRFGMAYVTTCFPGVIKAWHCHMKQTDCIATFKGMVKMVLHDAREDSPTKGIINEFFMGEDNPILQVIPPGGIYHGFTACGPETAYLMNCPTEPY